MRKSGEEPGPTTYVHAVGLRCIMVRTITAARRTEPRYAIRLTGAAPYCFLFPFVVYEYILLPYFVDDLTRLSRSRSFYYMCSFDPERKYIFNHVPRKALYTRKKHVRYRTASYYLLKDRQRFNPRRGIDFAARRQPAEDGRKEQTQCCD